MGTGSACPAWTSCTSLLGRAPPTELIRYIRGMAGHIPDSLSVDWCTPDKIVTPIHKVFGGPPALDPCSNPFSHIKATTEFRLDLGNDGLVDPWDGDTIFVNPPFGK